MNDDPREVLSLLNSFGYVGITAQQLKEFIKDLKLYRKIKERERHQWKEEIEKKIMHKQYNMMKEILCEQSNESRITKNSTSSNSSNFYDDSLMKMKVKYVPYNEEDKNYSESKENYTSCKTELHAPKTKCKETMVPWTTKSNQLPFDGNLNKLEDVKNSEIENRCPKYVNKNINLSKDKRISKSEGERILHPEKPVFSESRRPRSAPNLSECAQQANGSSRTRSVTSARNSTLSGSKSFIRPWRLQPKAQKSASIKKSDPVALYQKYQQEWKQISFPGDNKHANIRWAIREKILGINPHPPVKI